LLAGGAYAEYCVAPVAHCLPVPQGLDMIQVASLPETCFTVWSNLFDRARLKAGESLLVQGGTSGIGVTAIQIATAMGVKVFATAGSAEKCQFAQELGAVACVNYRDEDCFEQLRAVNEGRGMDVILDMVAGSYVPKEVSLLADDGRLVIIAVMGRESGSGYGADTAPPSTITGSTLRARPHDFKAALANSVRENVWPCWRKARSDRSFTVCSV
jgi:NADPH2:quinone reductase